MILIDLLVLIGIGILILEILYFWNREKRRKRERIRNFKISNPDLVDYVRKRNKEKKEPEYYGDCEICGEDQLEDQLKFLSGLWICLDCLRKVEKENES